MATAAEETKLFGPQLGYHSLDSEVSLDSLPIEGELPSWLSGSLLRNGPALFEDQHRSVNHWFDGQAMLHRFTLADGRVSYANRFLRTRAYEAARSGRLAFSEFATDPCRSIFKRLMTVFDQQVTDNTAVSLTRLGEKHYAMTEAPISVQFDPNTLQTLGYGERCPGTFATAHPHRDPVSGALINVATRMGRAQQLPVLLADARSAPTRPGQRIGQRARVRPFVCDVRALHRAYRVSVHSASSRDPVERSRFHRELPLAP